MLFEFTRDLPIQNQNLSHYFLNPLYGNCLNTVSIFLDIFKFNMMVDFVKFWNFYKDYCMVSSNINCVLVNLRKSAIEKEKY